MSDNQLMTDSYKLLKLYEDTTGICVADSNKSRTLAMIKRTRRMLESMLGYPLDEAEVGTNHYVESGKTNVDCPCAINNVDNLQPADSVTYAYRLFNYNKADQFFHIDPASAIHKVKLVKGNITFKTLDPDYYRPHSKDGFIKYIEQCKVWCGCDTDCDCVQLAVDATWLWEDDEDRPSDLLDVWMDMVTYYGDNKNNIKSETLGTHSYSKFENARPETLDHNIKILNKYVGGNGSLIQDLVL